MKSIQHKVIVTVRGKAWGGAICECDYEIKPSQIDDFKSKNDFKVIAGDFENIQRVEIVRMKITTDYETAILND